MEPDAEPFHPDIADSTPGGCFALVRAGDVEVRQARGLARLNPAAPLTAESPMGLGSIAKPIFSLAILRLCSEGRLSLEDPVARYLPELSAHGDNRLRHLLNHTSTLPDPYMRMMFKFELLRLIKRGPERFESSDLLARLARTRPTRRVPGRPMIYNNSAFDMLSQILERVLARPASDYLGELFHQWGMDSSYLQSGPMPTAGFARFRRRFSDYPPFPLDYVHGSGGIVSTLEDMLHFLRVLIEGRTGVSEALLEEAWKPTTFAEGAPAPYGLGWGVFGEGRRRVVWHNGGWRGFRSAFYWRRESGDAAIVLLNRDDLDPDEIALDALGVDADERSGQ
ncbi:hypothetical protein ABI59_06950 [Acidobacteria bacterium Mor1]|nr:hypothetical protein ABI59_06950 [Acidobacteria bacterium Mor1]